MVFLMCVIKDVDGISIAHLDDTSLDGLRRGSKAEQKKECNQHVFHGRNSTAHKICSMPIAAQIVTFILHRNLNIVTVHQI